MPAISVQAYADGASDQHLRAMGRVIVEWSEVEYYLELIIWLLSGAEKDKGQCITSHMSFPTKHQAALALTLESDLDQNFYEELKEILKGVDAVRVKRNRITHSRWRIISPQMAEGENIQSSIQHSARGKLKRHFEHWTPEDINEVSNNIRYTGDQLYAHYQKVRKALGLSP